MCPPIENEQTSPTGTPDTTLLDNRIGAVLDERGLRGGGGRGSDGSVGERLSRLEGAFEHALEGIRHGQNLMLSLAGIGFAVVLAVLIYMLQRIDNLPNDFTRINETLSAAITASKQQQPQVILWPTPQQAATDQKPASPKER